MGMTMTLLNIIVMGVSFSIGYFLNKGDIEAWKKMRIFLGYFLGTIVGCIGGTVIWAFLFVSGNYTDMLVKGLSQSFWLALVGAGIGVYYGLKKVKTLAPNDLSPV